LQVGQEERPMIARITQPKSDFMKRELKNPCPSNVKTLMYLLDVLLLGTYGNNNNNNNFKNLLYMMSPLCHACKIIVPNTLKLKST
jgi:hypothetical protein